jgi:hypothetical protein
MLKVLRRRVSITSSRAPMLGLPVDIHPDPVGRAMDLIYEDLVAAYPADGPGVCFHAAHILYGGERFGVTVSRPLPPLPDPRASLSRCRHSNEVGC